MPFGLDFAQLIALTNQVPGLVEDVKKAEPALGLFLEKAAALAASKELKTGIETIESAFGSNDGAKLLAQVKDVLAAASAVGPALAPVLLHARTLLHAIATTSTPEAAAAKLQAAKPPRDREGGFTGQ